MRHLCWTMPRDKGTVSEGGYGHNYRRALQLGWKAGNPGLLDGRNDSYQPLTSSGRWRKGASQQLVGTNPTTVTSPTACYGLGNLIFFATLCMKSSKLVQLFLAIRPCCCYSIQIGQLLLPNWCFIYLLHSLEVDPANYPSFSSCLQLQISVCVAR